MNFKLDNIPDRVAKPRDEGLTMVMDKGLSVRQVEDFLSVSGPYVDMVKLGFGTAFVTPFLREKIVLYRKANIKVYLGGTLFESFLIRGQYDDYKNVLQEFDINCAEISDGCVGIDHDLKCDYIKDLSKYVTVLSEVGSKDENKIIPPYKWIELIEKELEAGSWKVIAEAREGGNVGIFRGSGEIRSDLIEEILTKVPSGKLIWEAPKKSQQVWFVKLLGTNVNLGNIAPNEVIPLETLRLGLRGDTFDMFIPSTEVIREKKLTF